MSPWTAKQIWAAMAREQREAAAAALWEDTNLDRAGRLAALAPWLVARGMRPEFFDKLPRTRRAALMASGGLPEETASQALMSLHLRKRRPLLARFLDELGIPHEDGLIKEGEHPAPPSPEALEKAVAAIRAEFPAGDVDVYLRTLLATDPETWVHLGPAAGEPAA